MKKLLQRSALLLGVFTLVACGGGESESDDGTSGGGLVEGVVYWEGVEDTIVQLGDDFDLLDGVRAYDTTGDLSIAVIEDDYFTPHYVSSYSVVYEATTKDGSTEQTTRHIQVVKGVNVENGGFELGSNLWRFDVPGGNGRFSVKQDSTGNGYAEITVTDAGTEAWAIQLYQTGLRFESGKTYEMSFEMKSERNRSVAAGFEDVSNNYAMLNPGYQAQIVPSEWGVYTSYYTATQDHVNVKAVIYLGYGLEVDGTASRENPLDLLIDNIRVREVDLAPEDKQATFENAGTVFVYSKAEFDALPAVKATDYKGSDISDKIEIFGDVPTFVNAQTRMLVSYRVLDAEGNYSYINRSVNFRLPREFPYNLINGDFTNGFQGWIRDVNQTNGTGKADFIDNKDGTISIDIQDQSNASWHIQLFQNGVELEAGKVYRTTFIIKSDAAHSIDFEVSDPSAGFASMHTAKIDLTAEYQTITTEFRATKTVGAKFSLLLANSGVHTITIDKFENEEIDPTEATTIDLRDYLDHELINGDFKFGLYGWRGESSQGADVAYAADNVNETVIITINGIAPEPADWHAQLQQSNKVFEAGKTYEVSITAKAEVDTTIKVEVTNGSAEQTALKEEVLLTPVEQTLTFQFTQTELYDTGKFALLLGEATPTVITVSALTLTEVVV